MDSVTRLLSRTAAGHSLTHAYLISGGSSPGRDQVARHLAAAYVCTGEGARPCRLCLHCRKAEGSIHPDIVVLSAPEGKEITVSQVRTLRSDAFVRPNEAGRKVYLIPDAHRMNVQAQNALLKVLEEGPDYAAFLLLTDNPSAMLPTILSRCEALRLPPAAGELPSEEIQAEGRTLAQHLLTADEGELMTYLVGLEKWKREDFVLLLDQTTEALRGRLSSEGPAKVLPHMEHIRTLRRATDSNVGVGHMLAWLCALTHTTDNETPRRNTP